MTATPNKRLIILPNSLPPRGLRRAEAAAYIGVSPTTFDEMMLEGVMPHPKRFNSCNIWDRHALDEAFSCLPDKSGVKSKSKSILDSMSNS